MNKIVLHIPHSSERLPHGFLRHTLLNQQAVLDFRDIIADKNTKELFGKNNYKKVVFNWLRIFCDVEKFVDPQQEIMAQFGMGVVYTHTNKGERFFSPTAEYVNRVIRKYYLPHHLKLDKAVQTYLKKNSVILVDCHSFCKEIIMFDDKRRDLPDICIGYNEPAPSKVAEFVTDYFQNLGYKVKANYPYSGTMIPNCLLRDPNPNFCSFMIEINKDIYLASPAAFKTLQMQINSLLRELERLPS